MNMIKPRQPFTEPELAAIESEKLRLRTCGAGADTLDDETLEMLIVTGGVYRGVKDIAAKQAAMFREWGQDDLAVQAEGITHG